MARGTMFATVARWSKRGAVLLAFVAGVVVLLLWLAGKFTPKVPAAQAAPSQAAPIRGEVEAVRAVSLRLQESAVGTVRAVHETTIGSKLLARVLEVNLKAGQKVRVGDVLVRLDDTDLKAKLQQANAAVSAAEAMLAQATSDKRRYAQMWKSKVISGQEYEKIDTALRTAEADLLRARETTKEVQATLDWATVRAPIDGTVIDKKVDMGDMVTPGQPLVTLFDPRRMQLVASVRESLARRLRVDDTIDVWIEGLNKQCTGTISEIVPEAQAASRTFQVKVTGPCPTGIYAGMFGRIQIPLGQERVTVIPANAVRHVGQLELASAVENGQPHRRAIRTGRRFDASFNVISESRQGEKPAYLEVLSGLEEGERIVVPTGTPAAGEASHE